VQLLHDLSARRQASQGKQAIARRKAKELEAQRAAGKAQQQQMLSNTAVTADGAKTIARHNLRHGAAQSTHEEVTGVPLGQVGAAAAVTISTESDTDDSSGGDVAPRGQKKKKQRKSGGSNGDDSELMDLVKSQILQHTDPQTQQLQLKLKLDKERRKQLKEENKSAKHANRALKEQNKATKLALQTQQMQLKLAQAAAAVPPT
jgi:hypothetical protein